MTLEPLYTQCVMGLPDFLGHPFPGVNLITTPVCALELM